MEEAKAAPAPDIGAPEAHDQTPEGGLLAHSNGSRATPPEGFDETLALAAHEIRNPLAVIEGFAHTLFEQWETLPEEQKRIMAQRVATNSARLREIIEDFLTLSRATNGTQAPTPEPLLLSDLAAEISEVFADRTDLISFSDPASVSILCDGGHLQQILVNLVDNAIKYGAPPIDIAVAEMGGAITISVTDSGDGVPESFEPELFERFTRARTNGHADGTGLGLAIVRQLARMNGGDVSYEPVSGKGARFLVTLPSGT